MFFHRSNRIKTQQKIADPFEDHFIDNKRRLKIKNIRFSVGQQINKSEFSQDFQRGNDLKSIQQDAQIITNQKRMNFLSKLPQLNFQNRQAGKQVIRDTKLVATHQKKKEVLLNSILQILKPNLHLNSSTTKNDKTGGQIRGNKEWRLQTQPKQYANEFVQQMPQYSSTKHYRAPKILENQLMKFKNSNNIVRRKIFSEDKDRQKVQKEIPQRKKNQCDLQKIEILTFANKFPNFKKEVCILK